MRVSVSVDDDSALGRIVAALPRGVSASQLIYQLAEQTLLREQGKVTVPKKGFGTITMRVDASGAVSLEGHQEIKASAQKSLQPPATTTSVLPTGTSALTHVVKQGENTLKVQQPPPQKAAISDEPGPVVTDDRNRPQHDDLDALVAEHMENSAGHSASSADALRRLHGES